MSSYRTSTGPAGIIASAPRPSTSAEGIITSAPRTSNLMTMALGNRSYYSAYKLGDAGTGASGYSAGAGGVGAAATGLGRGGYASEYYARTADTGRALNRESTLTSGYTNTAGGLYAHVRTGRSSSKPVTQTRRTMTPVASGHGGASTTTTTATAETTTLGTYSALSRSPLAGGAGGGAGLDTSTTYADRRRTPLYGGYDAQGGVATSAVTTMNYTRTSTPGRVRPLTSHASSAYFGATLSRMPAAPPRAERVTLVLDLDETLVHSSFDPVPADIHVPLVMDGEHYTAYVKKRPYVERFLAACVELFDVIVWTASLSIYAEPLINELSRQARCGNLKKMYREHCTQIPSGGYVKDLTIIGRGLDDVCIVDNSPAVAQYQPTNLIPIVSWYEDPSDTALLDMIPFLEKLAKCQTVYDVIPTLGSYGLAS